MLWRLLLKIFHKYPEHFKIRQNKNNAKWLLSLIRYQQSDYQYQIKLEFDIKMISILFQCLISLKYLKRVNAYLDYLDGDYDEFCLKFLIIFLGKP